MNTQLETRHLKLMVAIAEEGTVSKASERLFLTQSALSHQLRDIEQKLGTTLFLRLKKRMALTPAGEKLLASSKKLLAEIKNVEDELKTHSHKDGGVLRLSTECYTCYHWLPPLIKKLSEKYPNSSVQIEADATRQPISALLDGKIDLAIVSSKIRNPKIEITPIFTDKLVAIVANNHKFASRKFLNAEDFADEHLFTYSLSFGETDLAKRLLAPKNIMPAKVSRIDLTEAIIEMVKANLGIAILADWAVRPQTELNLLKAISLTRKGLSRQWFAATLKNTINSEPLNDFIKLIGGMNL